MTMACAGPVAFGEFNMHAGSFRVTNLQVYNAPNREISRLSRLVYPGSIVSFSRDTEKIVNISGIIYAAGKSKRTMEALADRLRKNLLNGSQRLYVGYLDERYFNNVRLTGELEISWPIDSRQVMEWNANFLCQEPYLYGLESLSETDDNVLTLDSGAYVKSIEITNPGTAPAYPTVMITVPSAGPYGLSRIVIQNSSYNPSLRTILSRTFAADDQIVSDSINLTYTLNGNAVAFEGRLIELRPGLNTIDIRTLASSQPTLEVIISWKSRWL